MSERLAVVGYGSIGKRHLGNLRILCPEASIAVCRLSSRTQTEVPPQADFLCHSLEELIEFQPQAAVVATPASTHATISSSLAAAGIHLFIEKPLTTSHTSASTMSREIGDSGVVAMVGYNLRFQAGLLAIKQAIDERRVGRVLSVQAAVGQYLPDWRPDQDYRKSVSANPDLGGGVLLELSHELDYLLWLFGLPNKVNAAGGTSGSLDLQVEDLVELWLKYDSGPLVSVHLDFLDRAGFRSLRIVGEEGSIVWDAIRDDVTLHFGNKPSEHLHVGDPNRDRNECYVSELQHFLDCVESNGASTVTVSEAANVVAVIDAARSSLDSGNTMSVSYEG